MNVNETFLKFHYILHILYRFRVSRDCVQERQSLGNSRSRYRQRDHRDNCVQQEHVRDPASTDHRRDLSKIHRGF